MVVAARVEVGGKLSDRKGVSLPDTIIPFSALTPKDRLSVFSFGSYDFLGQRTASRVLTVFGTEFHRIDARYDHTLGQDGNLRLAVTAVPLMCAPG